VPLDNNDLSLPVLDLSLLKKPVSKDNFNLLNKSLEILNSILKKTVERKIEFKHMGSDHCIDLSVKPTYYDITYVNGSDRKFNLAYDLGRPGRGVILNFISDVIIFELAVSFPKENANGDLTLNVRTDSFSITSDRSDINFVPSFEENVLGSLLRNNYEITMSFELDPHQVSSAVFSEPGQFIDKRNITTIKRASDHFYHQLFKIEEILSSSQIQVPGEYTTSISYSINTTKGKHEFMALRYSDHSIESMLKFISVIRSFQYDILVNIINTMETSSLKLPGALFLLNRDDGPELAGMIVTLGKIDHEKKIAVAHSALLDRWIGSSFIHSVEPFTTLECLSVQKWDCPDLESSYALKFIPT
jgi:hypothetical protein